MTAMLRLTAADRVLVVAPHPDDESIACGGLLLAARDAGAARRVVTLTDGDNNPWPQRWLEKRWRIDAAARARWGARRREESQAALTQLGVAAGDRVFLGLPDTGLTSLLMRDTEKFVASLRAQIADFRPTHIVCPALADRHPDHSAAHIAVRLASSGAESPAQLLAYRVHGEGPAHSTYLLELSDAQRDAKRNAIASHRTQMALSGKRFLAFATRTEHYDALASGPRPDHPLDAIFQHKPGLQLRVRKQKPHGHRQILVLLADARGECLALECSLTTSPEHVELRDGHSLASAQWHDQADAWTLAVQVAAPFSPSLGFAKLARSRTGLVVFDRCGWQSVDCR